MKNRSHLQAVAPRCIRGQRGDAGGQPWDASLWANGEHWDGASGYVGMGAGK